MNRLLTIVAALLLLGMAGLYLVALREPPAPPESVTPVARATPKARPTPAPIVTPPPRPKTPREAARQPVEAPRPVDTSRPAAGFNKLTVSGRVVDDQGGGFAGARVLVRINGRPRSFKADEDGFFETPELTAGGAVVWAERRDGALSARSTPQTLEGAEDGGEFDVQLRLPSGRTAGIGVALGPHAEGARITRVGADGPGAEAGLATRDLIVEVDGEPVEGLSIAQIADRIKGQEGTRVGLTVLRSDGNEEEVLVERRYIERGAVLRNRARAR